MMLRKLSKITNKKTIFSSYNIFTNINISFFNLCFEDFSIIAKNVNPIKNNVVCFVAPFVFVFRCALTTDRYNAFQQIFVN